MLGLVRSEWLFQFPHFCKKLVSYKNAVFAFYPLTFCFMGEFAKRAHLRVLRVRLS